MAATMSNSQLFARHLATAIPLKLGWAFAHFMAQSLSPQGQFMTQSWPLAQVLSARHVWILAAHLSMPQPQSFWHAALLQSTPSSMDAFVAVTMGASFTAGALLMSMQKSLSPPVAVAVTLVSVCASAPGSIADNDRSTLTEVEPFLMGNDMALKVSEPTPSGKWQVFD